MSTPSQLQIRRIVWTGAIAAVTATGAWYGAGLKTQKDTKELIQKRREASNDEKLTQLEAQRAGLVVKRMGLERKLQELQSKMEEKTLKAASEGKK